MSFLILNDSGQVEFTKEGLSLPQVKELKKSCSDKEFELYGTYIYFVYNTRGLFAGKTPRKRRELVCNTYCKGSKPDDFESNLLLIAVAKVYMELNSTPKEQLYEYLLKDIQDLQEHLAQIPLYKKGFAQVKGEIEVEGQVVPYDIKVPVNIDNSKEKEAAIKMSGSLFTMEEDLRSKMDKEKADAEVSGTRLFEHR